MSSYLALLLEHATKCGYVTPDEARPTGRPSTAERAWVPAVAGRWPWRWRWADEFLRHLQRRLESLAQDGALDARQRMVLAALQTGKVTEADYDELAATLCPLIQSAVGRVGQKIDVQVTAVHSEHGCYMFRTSSGAAILWQNQWLDLDAGQMYRLRGVVCYRLRSSTCWPEVTDDQPGEG